jgi:hypothetical protein
LVTIFGASRLKHCDKKDPSEIYKSFTHDVEESIAKWRESWFSRHRKQAEEAIRSAQRDVDDVVDRYLPPDKSEKFHEDLDSIMNRGRGIGCEETLESLAKAGGMTEARWNELHEAVHSVFSRYEKDIPLLPLVVIDLNRLTHAPCPPKAKRGSSNSKKMKIRTCG